MKTFDATVTLETPGIGNAPQPRMPLARRIVLHWVVRLLITWFGFGLMTAATVAGLQALSVEIGPIVSVGLLSVCALLTVVAVTGLIERRNPAAIGLDVRHVSIDWLKGAGVGAAYLCASVGILALLVGAWPGHLFYCSGRTTATHHARIVVARRNQCAAQRFVAHRAEECHQTTCIVRIAHVRALPKTEVF